MSLSISPIPIGFHPVSDSDRAIGMAMGGFVGDALAMPVHWYYDRTALRRDYGLVKDYLAPKRVHEGSILWRSHYTALNERGEILHDQARYWGQRGIHYHQFLEAGENTLNLQLGRLLVDSLIECRCYDADDYLRRYLDFMLTPGSHRDTYVEECHRHFFTAYARGKKPRQCAAQDIHIGGLAHVGLLTAFAGHEAGVARAAVREHVGLTHAAPEVLEAADALTRMLVEIRCGGDLREVVLSHGGPWFSKRKAEQWSKDEDEVVIGRRLSSACYIRDAFAAALYLAWKYAGDFEAELIANTHLGGDNCHRGVVIGSLLGAALGCKGIPQRFLEGLWDASTLRERIRELVAVNGMRLMSRPV